MHIPDGYLSPKTCAVFYAVMAPVWILASRRVEKTLKLKQLPILALGAAFTFVIMMFNIPVPGGSTGHMVGGAVVAIVLGPWAGVVALSLALTLQAFLFGDGGITALAANSFNMAFIMSFSGYYIYRALSAGECGPARRAFSSAIAAYIAVNLAALAAGVELGIQPMIAHGIDGRPLYAPYDMSIALPAMAIPHLLFFGPVEALGTALVVSYVYRMNRELLHDDGRPMRPLWAMLGVLVVLTPLGLIATGTPWGEWGKEDIMGLLGYVPSGMDKVGDSWTALMPDYDIPWLSERFGGAGPVTYILSAIAGSAAIVLLIYLWGRLWPR